LKGYAKERRVAIAIVTVTTMTAPTSVLSPFTTYRAHFA
jgi:hypothetical protein